MSSCAESAAQLEMLRERNRNPSAVCKFIEAPSFDFLILTYVEKRVGPNLQIRPRCTAFYKLSSSFWRQSSSRWVVMSFPRLFSLLSLVLIVSAGSLVQHEHRKSAPPGFTNKGATADSHSLTLRFGLTSNNIPGLHDKLLSISTPGSPEFRKWLTQDEVKSFVAPSADTVKAFNSFASANGLKTTAVSPFGEWVTVALPVSKANKLFAAKYTNFTHTDLAAPITRTLSISLPSELVGHIDVVHPSTAFTVPETRLGQRIRLDRTAKRDATAPTECNTDDPNNSITPACLQALYRIPTTAATQENNALLVTGYEEQWAEIDDLQAFMKQFRPDYSAGSNQTFLRLAIDGGTNPQFPNSAGIEAQLDIEYTAGVATGVPLQFLTVGGFDFPTALLDTTTFLASDPFPPTVMTTSYGDNEENFGPSLATKICDGYAAATARGISVLFASGDGGVNGGHDDGFDCGLFIPVFPASCPYLTSVGSTIGFSPEVAVNFTGGGFSNVFPQPSYQSEAVAAFFKTIPANSTGDFNRTGRGYPDMSLQGWNFLITADGTTGDVSGTSASSPSAAAIISLVNDQLIAAGKPPLGFLNPFIYANPSAFNDIKIGHNSGFDCDESTQAFDAAAGWDPLSGMGTPDYERLLAAALYA
ncbi:Family S53 protease-like protein [Mycena indigotica]|uniref:tripeptidyl-peptidase II n=1 Tax=Mycena indigotica TaxID=2126181 RepID=A0A8H6SAM5_9AGAR|nr:Family S53 protease-like protein [Mycena indigotica]KAF7295211.1 Family S53 protease-like protein [Mycena indigotica]